MMNAREALFKDMLQNGWFTNSDGDVESPMGYFGYVWNETGDMKEVFEAFEETIEAYGKPDMDDVVGYFTATLSNTGVLWITRHNTPLDAQKNFNKTLADFGKWMEQDESDV